jgi:protein-tyrosine phosphatase
LGGPLRGLRPQATMIDIHCHPLPGVDDGAKSFEQAVQMCQMAARDGITHLVATPHCNYQYNFDPAVNQAKLTELKSAVGEKPKLLLGCDFHLSYDNIRMLVDNHTHYTVNGTSYVLVEFGEFFNPEQIDRVFYDVECAGLTPILTHPERNPTFQRKPDLLYRWISRGCLCQVTAKSYTGGFGSTAKRFAEEWLERNWIHVFASDAHDVKYRPPILSRCRKKLAQAQGEEAAARLLEKNPEAIINGRPLPPAPPPIDPDEKKAKKGWFSFLRK